MPKEIVMPRLSDTMDSGTVARWLKQEGDQIKPGDIIAEIETDKANMDLEAYDAGILAAISVREGESANVGEPIALIAKDEAEVETIKSGSAPSANGKVAAQPAETGAQIVSETPPTGETSQRAAQAATATQAGPVTDGQPPAAQDGGRIKASPLARRIAQEHGIDLAQIAGTGPGGRVIREDVQAFLKRVAAPQPAGPIAATQPAAAPQPSAAGGPRAPQPVEMTRMQQTIARRMTEARFSAPDFVLTAEIDMTAASALIAQIRSSEGAPRVGPNDLLIKAVAAALTQHPEVNAGWENGGIVRYGRINVGNAVAITGGLVVPVIQDADKKTLGQIATESKELIEKARSNKLAPSEYEGGTFSVSNLGMYGIDQFTPIINVPEACILGVGSIVPKPVVLDGAVVVRERMRMTLSCDHRVINGAQGAEFMQTLRRYLENPMLVVL